jgi:hypothetical protein
MKKNNDIKQQKLIKKANSILDRVEANLHNMVDTIKQRKYKKAA